MNPYEPLATAWREQMRRPGRAFSLALGFLLAVGSFVGFSHLFDAERLAEDELLRRVGGYFAAYAPLPAVGPASAPAELPRVNDAKEGFFANTVLTCLLPRRLAERLRALPGVAEAVPVLMFRMRSDLGGHLFNLCGIDMTMPLVVGRTCCAPSEVRSGVFLGMATGTDGPGAMLDEGYASVHEYRIGDPIRVGTEEFTVTGIVDTGVRPVRGDVYLTWDDAVRAVSSSLGEPLGDRANIFLVEVESTTKQETAMLGVKEITGGVINSYNCFRPASKVVGLNASAANILTAILYGMALLFGLKTQLAGVVERRREFGILRCIGWSDRVIGAQLIWEALLPALVGAFAGGILGVAVAKLAGAMILSGAAAGMLTFDVCLVVKGVALALLGSALSGIVAATVVRRSSPAETLRMI